MEAHDLATGLGDVVVGHDARRLADDQAAGIGLDGGLRGRLDGACGSPVSPIASSDAGAASLAGVGRLATFRAATSAISSTPGSPRPSAAIAASSLHRDRAQAHLVRQGGRERSEGRLVALDQLGLELDEATDDAPAGDDIDLVQAQVDAGALALQGRGPAQLADRDDLDERAVAGVLQDQGPGVGGRPVHGRGGDRSAGPSSSIPAQAPPGPAVWARDLTDTIVSLPFWRRRTAKPAWASAPSAVST